MVTATPGKQTKKWSGKIKIFTQVPGSEKQPLVRVYLSSFNIVYTLVSAKFNLISCFPCIKSISYCARAKRDAYESCRFDASRLNCDVMQHNSPAQTKCRIIITFKYWNEEKGSSNALPLSLITTSF